jgi:2-oxoisovalerate dehydrogenase E2 component (dihydrolipoyl transacylase)
MSFQVELPHVGESVTEAVIGKWLIKPGDQIEKYDPLVEVITDKVNMDVPSPATGTLTKILAEEGETVLMGAVIAELETGEESAPVTPTESSPAQSATSSPSASRIGTLVQGANVGPTGGEFLDTSLSTNEPAESSEASERSGGVSRRQKGFSPVVTRLAAQHGIDLNSLVGTGLGRGRGVWFFFEFRRLEWRRNHRPDTNSQDDRRSHGQSDDRDSTRLVGY